MYFKLIQTDVKHTKLMKRLISGNLWFSIPSSCIFLYYMQNVLMGIFRMLHCTSLAALISDPSHVNTLTSSSSSNFNLLEGQHTYSFSKSSKLTISVKWQAGSHLILCCKRLWYMKTGSNYKRLHYWMTPKVQCIFNLNILGPLSENIIYCLIPN